MKRLRIEARVVVLAIALGAGGLAAWATRHYLDERVAVIEARGRVETVAVVVAAEDLDAGVRLDADRVAVRDVPRDWAPLQAFSPDRFDVLRLAELAHPVRRGEVILPAHLAAASNAPFSTKLRPGRRAVTLAVDEISSVSGMLAPGDAIDVYVSFEHRGKRVTRLLLPGVRVLATGRQVSAAAADTEARTYSTVTLDTTPEQAVRLIVARQGGTISAVLRAAGDTRRAAPAQAGDLAAVFGIAPTRPPAPSRVGVIYGDRAPTRVPALAGRDTRPDEDAEEAAASPQGSGPGSMVPAGGSWEVDVDALRNLVGLPGVSRADDKIGGMDAAGQGAGMAAREDGATGASTPGGEAPAFVRKETR